MKKIIVRFADVAVDSLQRVMCCGEQSIPLAPAELRIMLCLVSAAGSVVEHAVLERAGWGRRAAVTRSALEVTLHRLRKKLVTVGALIRILNIRGVGFLLVT